MLVLTRKTNESIFIDGGIEVMVVQVRGNRVRLGFRAPSDVLIQRKERVVGASGAPVVDEQRSLDFTPAVAAFNPRLRPLRH